MWGLQAKLMHDPASFDAIRSSVPIEHQSLSHPYYFLCYLVDHRTIFSGCFPVARCRRAICSVSRGILAVAEAEEVPLIGVELCHLYSIHGKQKLMQVKIEEMC